MSRTSPETARTSPHSANTSTRGVSAPTSDIAALMVLEHQLHMHNFLTRLNYEATLQLKAYGHCNYIKSPLEAFLRYLLFTEETP